MTRDELRSKLRLHGIGHITDVDRAYRKANGMISIIRCDRKQPNEPRRSEAAL